MIPRADIVAWRSDVFWRSDAQVEQDLILSRVLVELFSEKFLAKNLAFRGGTALHKLHLAPASRCRSISKIPGSLRPYDYTGKV